MRLAPRRGFFLGVLLTLASLSFISLPRELPPGGLAQPEPHNPIVSVDGEPRPWCSMPWRLATPLVHLPIFLTVLIAAPAIDRRKLARAYVTVLGSLAPSELAEPASRHEMASGK